MTIAAKLAEIRQKIARDKMDKALVELEQLFEGHDEANQLIMLTARYNKVQRESRMGILSHTNGSIEMNKIRNGLLALMKEFEEELGEEEAPVAERTLNALLDRIKKGEAGSGDALWELMQPLFEGKREKALLEKLRQDAENAGYQGALLFALEGYLEEHPALSPQLNALLQAEKDTMGRHITINIINSSNVVVDSDMQSGGDIIIGGSKNSDSES